MEKDASLRSDPTSIQTLNSPSPPLSPKSDNSGHKHQEEFASNVASLYQSPLPPESQFPSSLSLSPSPPSSSSPAVPIDITTKHRPHHTRLNLEHNEHKENYELCLVQLQSLRTEIASLRRGNAELLRLIQMSTPTTSSSAPAAAQPAVDFGPQIGVIEPKRSARRNNVERTVMPKSFSVRSSNQGCGGAGRQSQLDLQSVPQKVSVPTGGQGEKEEVELEAYRQGMPKTEICNNWQETGACSYGDHCQFAHGFNELRPVIRDPSYKTRVCRYIATGARCPFGYRCHFYHPR